MKVDATTITITNEQIWDVALVAVRTRDTRLLGYCDAALRGGRRRDEEGRKRCAIAWNARFGDLNGREED